MVNSQGFILTNRHWRRLEGEGRRRRAISGNRTQAFLLTKTIARAAGPIEDIIDLKKLNLKRWVPEDDGGFIFRSRRDAGSSRSCRDLPQFAQNHSTKPFYGKNEIMTVRFPNSRLSINADLVRTSTDEDIALLKINSPEPLVPLTLAPTTP